MNIFIYGDGVCNIYPEIKSLHEQDLVVQTLLKTMNYLLNLSNQIDSNTFDLLYF